MPMTALYFQKGKRYAATPITELFTTNIPCILDELKRNGNLREFDFSDLEKYTYEVMGKKDNIFSPGHNR